MKKLAVALMAVAAITLFSCNKKNDPVEPVQVDSTFVSFGIRYDVECTAKALEILDVNLEYVNPEDSSVVSKAINEAFTSDVFKAKNGVAGYRLKCELKEGVSVTSFTEALLDSVNGLYFKVNMMEQEIFEGYQSNFSSISSYGIDLRGKSQTYLMQLIQNIEALTQGNSYAANLNYTDDDYISITANTTFWDEH